MSHDFGIPIDTAASSADGTHDELARALVNYFEALITPSTRILPEDAAQRIDAARESVRWAARTIAVTERAAGTSPEHVVVLLKKILTDAYDLTSGFIPIRPVREDVVRWAIDAYFER